MCGIIGAVSKQTVNDLLVNVLKKLSYRGYDSAGIATINKDGNIQSAKSSGKVSVLEQKLQKQPCCGNLGIGHTRWATHGKPTTNNAHPHISHQQIAIVHNGIIENHQQLRAELMEAGYEFTSETDSEVFAHLLHQTCQKQDDFNSAIIATCQKLSGRYAIAIINNKYPDILWGICNGSPLCIGLAEDGNFLASDAAALTPPCTEAIYLQDGDIAQLKDNEIKIFDKQKKELHREKNKITQQQDTEKGNYRYYMAKEIDEQPKVLNNTLFQNATKNNPSDKAKIATNEQLFNQKELQLLKKIKRIHIVACGTSYHAALVAQYWLEDIARIPVRVETASEMRYRNPVVSDDTLLIALSQSGETADTLAAFNDAEKKGYAATLAICNRNHSSLAKQANMLIITAAGVEVGVAATKTFTCQLAALLLFTLTIAKLQPHPNKDIDTITKELEKLPQQINKVITLEDKIKKISLEFSDTQNSLFLGRGIHYPIAMEGALKLKEISYIHAEAYPSGELKHGPLALVDKHMPVVVVAPQDHVWQKLAANIEEVSARGANTYIFADERLKISPNQQQRVVTIPRIIPALSPFLQTIPLQQLAYHVALIKGTDVDQPRNLAKSVTVE